MKKKNLLEVLLQDSQQVCGSKIIQVQKVSSYWLNIISVMTFDKFSQLSPAKKQRSNSTPKAEVCQKKKKNSLQYCVSAVKYMCCCDGKTISDSCMKGKETPQYSALHQWVRVILGVLLSSPADLFSSVLVHSQIMNSALTHWKLISCLHRLSAALDFPHRSNNIQQPQWLTKRLGLYWAASFHLM